jgi:DNA polymerase-3 subunit gamma/tau
MVLGTAADAVVGALTAAWLESDGVTGLKLIYEALSSGVDARQFCRQMVSYLRQLLLLQAAGGDLPIDAPAEQRVEMLAQAQRADRDRLVAAIRTFSEAALAPATSWQPQLPLELAFIELLPARAPKPAPAARMPAATVPEVAIPSVPKPPEPAPILDVPVEQTLLGDEAELSEPTSSPLPPAASELAAPAPEAAEELTLQPVEQAAEEVTTAAPALTLELFRAQWPAMVQRLERRDRNLPPLLAMCRPLAVEGNTLFLGFEFPQLKEKFERRPEVLGYMVEAYQALIGVECNIRCVLTKQYRPRAAGQNSPPTPPGGAPKSAVDEREAFLALADELGGTVHES